MKKQGIKLAGLLLLFVIPAVLGQNGVAQLNVQQLIQPRKIYLNGGVNASLGGTSRTTIKIDLPPNTIAWYYSFSTSRTKTDVKNLSLATQLRTLLSNQNQRESGLLSKISVPSGYCAANTYLCDATNAGLFQRKADNNGGSFSHIAEGTVTNTFQSVVRIDDVTSGTWYLGIKNPSEWRAAYITIEVVAITQESMLTTVVIPALIDAIFTKKEREPEPEKTEEQRRAESYGTMAWGYYENKQIEKALTYCDKSLELYALGWVKANKGLMQLISGKEDEAVETYIDAIALIHKQWRSDYVFKHMIKDLKRARKKYTNRAQFDEIIQMIKQQQG